MSDVGVGVSLGMIGLFMVIGLCVVSWIFKTGYKIKP